MDVIDWRRVRYIHRFIMYVMHTMNAFAYKSKCDYVIFGGYCDWFVCVCFLLKGNRLVWMRMMAVMMTMSFSKHVIPGNSCQHSKTDCDCDTQEALKYLNTGFYGIF